MLYVIFIFGILYQIYLTSSICLCLLFFRFSLSFLCFFYMEFTFLIFFEFWCRGVSLFVERFYQKWGLSAWMKSYGCAKLQFVIVSCFPAPDNRFDVNGCTSTQTVSNSGGGNFVLRVDFSIEFQRSGSSRNSGHHHTGRLGTNPVSAGWSHLCGGLSAPADSAYRSGWLFNPVHICRPDGMSCLNRQATGEVLLKNGQTVFCSRRRKRETREAFLAYARTLSRRL